MLATLRSRLEPRGSTAQDRELQQLARDALPAIASVWNSAQQALRPESLRLFYDVSVQVRPLLPRPQLEATWEAFADVLDDPEKLESRFRADDILEAIRVIAAK